jgi:hypothetical protein
MQAVAFRSSTSNTAKRNHPDMQPGVQKKKESSRNATTVEYFVDYTIVFGEFMSGTVLSHEVSSSEVLFGQVCVGSSFVG